MTELDRACIDALRTCSFLPGSAPKRFARAMGEAWGIGPADVASAVRWARKAGRKGAR